jgi:hypothetical protein
MKIGIFAKTFSRPTIEDLFALQEEEVAFSRDFLRRSLAL